MVDLQALTLVTRTVVKKDKRKAETMEVRSSDMSVEMMEVPWDVMLVAGMV